MTTKTSRGRRRGNPDTRAEILEAARIEFAEGGYNRATIRAIASRAGVDPSLVLHYFGSKEQLFAESLDVPVSPAMVMREVFASSEGSVGQTLLLTMLTYWDASANTNSFVAVLRSATGEGRVNDLVREFFEATILATLEEHMEGPDAPLRAALAASHLAGLLMGRYLLALDALTHASREDIAARVGPMIDAYLFGPDG